jgi:zinc/manganese transport system substrate-binding protein
MRRLILALSLSLAAGSAPAVAEDERIPVVAAENFYGDIAAAIGGDRVTVTSVLSNPDQDPHLFEATPSVARGIANARLVIINGAGYDRWMPSMLEASPAPARAVITAADLVGARPGDNPHLWYNPATIPRVAAAIADALAKIDPAHDGDYRARLAALTVKLAPIAAKAAAIKARFAGTPVAATEPVFGLMAQALGLDMREEAFQRSVMNDTEPSAADVAAFETDLRQHKVKALFYNAQVTDPQADRLVALARENAIPVVGVTETEPAGASFSDWMLGQLDATAKALAGPSS